MVTQVRTIWTGPSSPLYSMLHFVDGSGTPQQMATAVAAFWGSVDDNVNAAYSWAIDTEVRHFNEATGDLTGITNVTAAGATAGSAGQYIDLIQALIVWNTGTVVDGRLLRGRTFVPGIDESRNAATGRPESTFKDALAGSAATLIADTNTQLCVWHRPKFEGTKPNRVRVRDGSHEVVTAASVANKWSYLKSRRLG